MKMLTPLSWKDYELIDSGDGEKLERFGDFTLIRPEPQALWKKALPETEWSKLSTARFDREQKDKYRFADEVRGGWSKNRGMPESWQITHDQPGRSLILRLALTGFGHVGMFPEQAENWNYIRDTIGTWRSRQPRVLNLFAYTGAASVVARMAGAEVTHVDASRPGINWANKNMQLNNVSDIRWVHEDALKFVKREVKRGNKYNGIIMDPPPYGRGPAGEKWTLHEKLYELVDMTSRLLDQQPGFFILSMYAAGLPALVGRNVVTSCFPHADPEYGEFFLTDRHDHPLPMGTYVRFATT